IEDYAPDAIRISEKTIRQWAKAAQPWSVKVNTEKYTEGDITYLVISSSPAPQCPAVNLENTKKDVLNSFYCGRSEVSQFKGREVSKRERNKNNISLTKGCHILDLPGFPRNQRSFLQPLKGGGHPQKSLKGEANLAEVVFVPLLLVAKSPVLLSQEYPYSLIAPLKKDTIFLSNLSSILSSEDDTASSPIIKNRDRDRYSASSPVDVTRRDFLKRILGSAGAVVLGTSAITQGRVVASGNGGQRKKMAVLISGYSQIIRYLNLFVFNTYARFYFKSQGVDIHIIDDARRNDLRRVLGDSTIHYVAVVGEGGWSHWMATDGTVFENDIAEWESERKINKKELFIRYTCGKRDWDETGGYCPYEGIIEELIPVYDIPLDKADVVKRMLEAEKIEIGSIGCRWGKRDDGAYVAKSAVMYVLKKDAWPTDEYLKAKLKSLGLRESRYSYDEGQVEGFSITEHHKFEVGRVLGYHAVKDPYTQVRGIDWVTLGVEGHLNPYLFSLKELEQPSSYVTFSKMSTYIVALFLAPSLLRNLVRIFRILKKAKTKAMNREASQDKTDSQSASSPVTSSPSLALSTSESEGKKPEVLADSSSPIEANVKSKDLATLMLRGILEADIKASELTTNELGRKKSARAPNRKINEHVYVLCDIVQSPAKQVLPELLRLRLVKRSFQSASPLSFGHTKIAPITERIVVKIKATLHGMVALKNASEINKAIINAWNKFINAFAIKRLRLSVQKIFSSIKNTLSYTDNIVKDKLLLNSVSSSPFTSSRASSEKIQSAIKEVNERIDNLITIAQRMARLLSLSRKEINKVRFWKGLKERLEDNKVAIEVILTEEKLAGISKDRAIKELREIFGLNEDEQRIYLYQVYPGLLGESFQTAAENRIVSNFVSSSPTAESSLDRMIALFPNGYNWKGFAKLGLKIEMKVSLDAFQQGLFVFLNTERLLTKGVFCYIDFTIDYQVGDSHKTGEISLLYNLEQEEKIVMYSLYPKLPPKRGLGRTLVWLLLNIWPHWENRQIILDCAIRDAQRMAEGMPDMGVRAISEAYYRSFNECRDYEFTILPKNQEQQDAIAAFWRHVTRFVVTKDEQLAVIIEKAQEGKMNPKYINSLLGVGQLLQRYSSRPFVSAKGDIRGYTEKDSLSRGKPAASSSVTSSPAIQEAAGSPLIRDWWNNEAGFFIPEAFEAVKIALLSKIRNKEWGIEKLLETLGE
ncbi:MAG: hypothetical protein WA066_01545, partial [Candidatus Omnitrophota bacterium]